MRRFRALAHLLLGLLWLSQGVLASAATVPMQKQAHAQNAVSAVSPQMQQDLPPCHRQAVAEAPQPQAKSACDCCGADSHCVHAAGFCLMLGTAALPSAVGSWPQQPIAAPELYRVESALGPPDPVTLLRPPSPPHV